MFDQKHETVSIVSGNMRLEAVKSGLLKSGFNLLLASYNTSKLGESLSIKYTSDSTCTSIHIIYCYVTITIHEFIKICNVGIE